MNYPAGLLVRVLYSISLLGLVIVGGLMGSSWAGLVLGGSIFGGIRPLVFLCVALFRIIQVFRNPQALDIYAPSAALRFFRGLGLFLMFGNLLSLGAVLFIGPITNWLFHGHTGDNGIAYFIVSLGMVVGLLVTSAGVLLFEAVRLVGNAHKRNSKDEKQAPEPKAKYIFGLPFHPLLALLALVWIFSYFLPFLAPGVNSISDLVSSPPPHFDAVCSETGINIASAPRQEVRSIYLDRNRFLDSRYRYPIRDKNRVGPQYWGSEFIPELAVDSPDADVVVTYQADDTQAAGGPFAGRKLVRYIVSATDQRNHRLLGTMSYAVDVSNGYACGANTPEGIDVNAFLRQVTSIPGQQHGPRAPIPTTAAELVSWEAFSPVKVLSLPQWNDELQISPMSERCNAMLPRIGPHMRRFTDASDGLRVMQDDTTEDIICLDTAIFRVANIGERDNQPIRVDKYTTNGRHLYALHVSTSNAGGALNGFVVMKGFGAQDGFLHFEKWQSEQSGETRLIERISRFRVAEPKEMEADSTPPDKGVPDWATYFHEENVEVEQEFTEDANSTILIRDMEERAKDKQRRSQCDRIAPADPFHFGMRRFAAKIANAATGTGMQELGIADLCDDEAVWSIGSRHDLSGDAFVVQKYTPAGVLQYKVKFRVKQPNDNQTWAFLIEPSLQSRDGYLHFDLWLCRRGLSGDNVKVGGNQYLVMRHVAARVKEPPL